MYLSRIAIDMASRNTMRALDNPEILHGMVEACFPEEHQRDLWRLDKLNKQTYLLLLSRDEPDLKPLATQIGLSGTDWETRDYQPLLNRIRAEGVWRFRLVANPVTSIPKPGERRGKVKAITIAAQQCEWLSRQGERHGFLVKPGQFDVVQSEWKVFRNKGRAVSILSATFEGILTVTDTECFLKALQMGVGRGKAYGMGLLTVMSNE